MRARRPASSACSATPTGCWCVGADDAHIEPTGRPYRLAAGRHERACSRGTTFRCERLMSCAALRAATVSMLLAGASACGVLTSVRPHLPQTTSQGPRASVPSADPSRGTPTLGGRTGAARARYPEERRVCRTSTRPRGWIAVAYVSAPEQCPARAGADSAAAAATMAVITPYEDRPLGTVLDVCADEPRPTGWNPVFDESTEDTGSCPGAGRGDGPTTRRIRRIR
jgi:hypothetical protein